MKKIWVITLLPELFAGFQKWGVVGAGLSDKKKNLPRMNLLRISDFCDKGFKGADAAPYGGGAGMVLRADVLENCLLKGVFTHYENPREDLHIIATGPRGMTFNQAKAQVMSSMEKDLVFVCGRYEGIDERFLEKYVDEHISLGDFIMSGGELACMAYIDAMVRLMEGTLGSRESIVDESFNDSLLEYPHYTRPKLACDREVPEVLMSGDHQNIRSWRDQQKKLMTRKYRPDLLGDSE